MLFVRYLVLFAIIGYACSVVFANAVDNAEAELCTVKFAKYKLEKLTLKNDKEVAYYELNLLKDYIQNKIDGVEKECKWYQ